MNKNDYRKERRERARKTGEQKKERRERQTHRGTEEKDKGYKEIGIERELEEKYKSGESLGITSCPETILSNSKTIQFHKFPKCCRIKH